MTEHFLNRSEIGASLEQVSGERMPEEVRMDTCGVEARNFGQTAQDEERSGAGQRAAFRVEKQFGTVPPVEVGPTP